MDYLVTVNPYFIKKLEGYGIKEEKMLYIPNFVYSNTFYPMDIEKRNNLRESYGIKKDDFVVLSVGQVQTRKGIMDFINVAESLKEVKFLWAGGFSFGKITSGYKELKQIIDNPSGNVKFLDIVPRDKINEIYNLTKILIDLKERTMKVIVLTGGGSSGHVTPNIALIPNLLQLGYTVHYIGSYNGIEKQLIEKEGIPFHSINAGKLRRYFDFKNITDIFKVMDGFRQSLSILKKLKPDILFSKGGFVSCPVVWAAWLRRVPIVIHESDITPGLTNRLSIPFAGKVCFTFPESAEHMPKDKGVLTGLPVRENLLHGEKSIGRTICGFNSTKPVLMVIGGSQGSENINKVIRKALDVLQKEFQICHICGKGNTAVDLEGVKGYKQFEYINEELSHIFALADIVVSRAGATALFEILALRKPNLLIPLSKNASRGDQVLNAQSFEKQGFSCVLIEEHLSEETLVNNVIEVYKNRNHFINTMAASNKGTATDSIIRVLQDYSKTGNQD
jgi:UDP-N-acetylglucosamine--N-acetylmuramyl-(pentapeptide) pyrophosphoryl-undecaprenol N-acetylglucosamine transferase